MIYESFSCEDSCYIPKTFKFESDGMDFQYALYNLSDAEAKKRGYILHIPVSTLNPNNKESIKHPFCKTNTVHKDT